MTDKLGKDEKNKKLKLRLSMSSCFLILILIIYGGVALSIDMDKTIEKAEKEKEVMIENVAKEIEADSDDLILTLESSEIKDDKKYEIYKVYYNNESYIFKIQDGKIITYSKI